jgi:hypothetical protein
MPETPPLPDTPPGLPTPGLPARLTVAVLAGLVVALLGTALHARALYADGVVLPWGAAAALLLLLSAAVYVALWGRAAWLSAVTGGVAYALAGIFAAPRNGYSLIIANLQGALWLYGSALCTVLAVVLAWLILRRRA